MLPLQLTIFSIRYNYSACASCLCIPNTRRSVQPSCEKSTMEGEDGSVEVEAEEEGEGEI